jgi:hypothetical protein
MQNLIDAVKKHANEHYEDGGWDVLVECWSDKDILNHLNTYGARTEKQAVESFKTVVSVWADRQADARNSAF